MNSINLIYLAIFLPLTVAIFLISGLDEGITAERRRRKKAGDMRLRRQTLFTKLARLEQKRRKLVADTNISESAYWLLTALCAGGGAVIGRLFFSHPFFAVTVGILGAFGPLFYLSYRLTRLRGQRVEKILASMMLLSNSYIVTADFIQSVQDNIEALEFPEPFQDFLIYVSYINGNIKTGLRHMESRVDNLYFSQWIDVLILAQDDRNMKYVTMSIVDAMADVHQVQRESNTAMYSIWREYFTVLVLIFAAPVIFRVLMQSAYVILITTLPGQALLTLLLVTVVYSLVKAVELNKPMLM